MIRGYLCLILIVLSLFLATSGNIQFDSSRPAGLSPTLGSVSHGGDPVNGTLYAFNATYAQFDLYTNKTAALRYGTFANNTRPNSGAPPGNLTWFSNIVNTRTGVPVNGTGFKFISNATGISQSINWTINTPKGVGANTYLRFDWNGTLPKGTSARYQLYNVSRTTPFLNVTKIGPPYPLTVTGGPPLNNTGGIPISCGATDECFDITKYVGFNITLVFIFNSNATGRGLKFQVSNIEVASLTTSQFQTVSNFMFLNPANATEVIHSADLPLTYNATVTYHKPNTPNGNLTHTWGQMVVTVYMPVSYKLTSINLNGTIPLSLTYAIGQGPCATSFCTNSQFLALNMTLNKTARSIAVVQAKSINAEASLETALVGVPTDFWVPGEFLSVRVNNRQGVNGTGSNIVWARNPLGLVPLNQTFRAPKKGFILLNFTTPLPQSPLGHWNITGVFISGYDYGIQSHVVTLDQIQLSSGSFTYGGSNTLLTVQGKLVYASNQTSAANVNAMVFTVDAGSRPGPITTTNSSSSGLYIQNITLVNGVFTGTQPLTMFFTVVNPTPAQGFNANLTIQQEWQGSQTHGALANVALDLGDQFFTFGPAVYRTDILILPSGMQITVTSLTTQNKKTVTGSLGAPPVVPSRQHAGLFKITIASKQLTGTATYSNSLESPTYAYLSSQAAATLIPSRLLAFKSFVTAPDGTFSATLASNRILGAKKLVLFVLARDANGIVLGNQDPTAATDFTLLQSSLDAPSEAAVKQPVSLTLHLKNNSTKITFNVTINLELSGSGIVQSKTAVLPPGGRQQDLPFMFTTPSSPGVYILTFSSSEYGAPLLTKTLQVSLLQSNLQILIPAIIGLVVALVILGFYLMKKSPEVAAEAKEKQRPVSGKPSKPQAQSPRNP